MGPEPQGWESPEGEASRRRLAALARVGESLPRPCGTAAVLVFNISS